uniref:Uncharacterized protein n=1 Tax=Knipowitschia caucasica TaxID=637954 RepID=A0AAV2L4K7_KNICA
MRPRAWSAPHHRSPLIRLFAASSPRHLSPSMLIRCLAGCDPRPQYPQGGVHVLTTPPTASGEGCPLAAQSDEAQPVSRVGTAYTMNRKLWGIQEDITAVKPRNVEQEGLIRPSSVYPVTGIYGWYQQVSWLRPVLGRGGIAHAPTSYPSPRDPRQDSLQTSPFALFITLPSFTYRVLLPFVFLPGSHNPAHPPTSPHPPPSPLFPTLLPRTTCSHPSFLANHPFLTTILLHSSPFGHGSRPLSPSLQCPPFPFPSPSPPSPPPHLPSLLSLSPPFPSTVQPPYLPSLSLPYSTESAPIPRPTGAYRTPPPPGGAFPRRTPLPLTVYFPAPLPSLSSSIPYSPYRLLSPRLILRPPLRSFSALSIPRYPGPHLRLRALSSLISVWLTLPSLLSFSEGVIFLLLSTPPSLSSLCPLEHTSFRSFFASSATLSSPVVVPSWERRRSDPPLSCFPQCTRRSSLPHADPPRTLSVHTSPEWSTTLSITRSVILPSQ